MKTEGPQKTFRAHRSDLLERSHGDRMEDTLEKEKATDTKQSPQAKKLAVSKGWCNTTAQKQELF